MIRYAVVGAGWISQEAFMPAVATTGNSRMQAIVSGSREAAQKLAVSMEGRLTDERGVALPESTLDQVGQQLESLYDMLESRDLPAGSKLARRLFS